MGLDFYEHQDTRILIPTLYGAEAKKEVTGSTSVRRTWDAESFFVDAAARVHTEALAAVRAVHDWALKTAEHVDYGTGKTGSFTPKFRAIRPKGPISVYADGVLQLKLNLGWFNDTDAGRSFQAVLVREFAAAGIIASGPHTSDAYLSAEQWCGKAEALTRALARAVPVAA